MKVVAFNGSPNQNGNTACALQVILNQLSEHSIETELIQVGSAIVSPCIGCKNCFQTGYCVQSDDSVNIWIKKMENADGIILGSPVYFAGIASPMKSFLDRAFYVAARKRSLRGKIGAAVVAVRRSGGTTTLDNLYRYLTYSEMLIACGSYWSVIHGREPGEVLQDEEGLDTLRILGENMSWALEIREASKENLPYPNTGKRHLMNFIR
ncbi:MAG: flavodoxin family protein [Lachnospiraceae bacterium]|nr:flavodoxin family protein [Lachnospiraceae bacterium]